MLTAVDIITRTYKLVPFLAIPLNILCIIISRKYVSKRYSYMTPINCLVFAINILLAILLWILVPAQVIFKGVNVTVCLHFNSELQHHFFYLFLIVENYAVFSTLLTYIVLTIIYVRPSTPSKILLYSSLVFIPVALVTVFKFMSNYNEWRDSTPLFRSTVLTRASEQLGISLDGSYIFGKIATSNKAFYILEIIFSGFCLAAYIFSFIGFLLLEKYMPFEKVLTAKLMFSKELRLATKASIIVILLGLAAPRTVLNVALLVDPNLSTIVTIPIFLGDCLATLVIPIIFLTGFYAKYLKRLFFQIIPTLKISISPQTGDDNLVGPSTS